MKFVLEKMHRGVSDEDLIADLQSVAKKIGVKKLTQAVYRKYGAYDPSTFTRRFESWLKVLDRAGLDRTRTEMNVSEEELFSNLEELWLHFGRQPRYHEVVKPLSRFSNGTYAHRYGSFTKALEAFVAAMDGDVRETKRSNAGRSNPRSINYRMRFKVLQRDGYRCCMCGASPAKDPNVVLHIDHKMPVSKGGSCQIDNLQTLCSKCNLGKSNLTDA